MVSRKWPRLLSRVHSTPASNPKRAEILAHCFLSRAFVVCFPVANFHCETTVWVLPTPRVLTLGGVAGLRTRTYTYLRHCSCRCYIIPLLFCNEKPASSSSPPLLSHLLANKGSHYLQLHGSHQLQNCRYCNTQNTLKRNRRNNYMCKTPQLNFCRKRKTESAAYLKSWPLSSEETSSIWTWSHSWEKGTADIT